MQWDDQGQGHWAAEDIEAVLGLVSLQREEAGHWFGLEADHVSSHPVTC